jgi:hypothetical protein
MDKPFLKKPRAFVSANPNATFDEFYEATECSSQQYYDARYQLKKTKKVSRIRRITDSTKFIVANPNATFEEYEKAFPGSTRKDYTSARANGVAYFKQRGIKNIIEPIKTRTRDKKNKFKQPEVVPKSENKTFTNFGTFTEDLLKQAAQGFEKPKDEITTHGITPEFVWYESSLIRDALSSAVSTNLHRFDRVVKVMESRHAEHLKMLQDVMNENRDLRIKNRELNEMLDRYTTPKDKNGTSV